MLEGCCSCDALNIKDPLLFKQDNDCPHSDNRHMHCGISNELHYALLSCAEREIQHLA